MNKSFNWSPPNHYLNQGWVIVNWTLGKNFSEILNEIHAFSFKKIHLNVLFAKWRPFCLGLNVLKANTRRGRLKALVDIFMIVALTKSEILAQGFLLFVAGYETTSSGLSLLLYCLALHPECQKKVQEEIDRVVSDKVIDISFNNLSASMLQ